MNDHDLPEEFDPDDGVEPQDALETRLQALADDWNADFVEPPLPEPALPARAARRWLKPMGVAAGLVAAATVTVLVIAAQPGPDLSRPCPAAPSRTQVVSPPLAFDEVDSVEDGTGTRAIPTVDASPTPESRSTVNAIPLHLGNGSKLAGTTRWSNAVQDDDLTKVTITVPHDACGTSYVPIVTAESPARVTIELAEYKDPIALGQPCDAVFVAPGPVTVSLAFPLTSADLSDGRSVRHLIRAADLPEPTYLPVGYTGGYLASTLEGDGAVGLIGPSSAAVSRRYSGPDTGNGSATLLLSAYPVDQSEIVFPADSTVAAVKVDGHPAEVRTWTSGLEEQVCLYWQSPEQNAQSLCSLAPQASNALLDSETLVRVAESVLGPISTTLDYPLSGVRWTPVATIDNGVVTSIEVENVTLRFRSGTASMSWPCYVTNHPITVHRSTMVSSGSSSGPGIPCTEAERAAGDSLPYLLGHLFAAGMPMQYRIDGNLLTVAEGPVGVVYRGELGDNAIPKASVASALLPSQGLLHRTWVLRTSDNQAGAIRTHSLELGLTSTDFTLSTYCNPTWGRLEVEGDTMQFSDVTTTAMACLVASGVVDPAVADQLVTGALLSSSPVRFTLQGSGLTITGPDGESVLDGSSALDVALPQGL